MRILPLLCILATLFSIPLRASEKLYVLAPSNLKNRLIETSRVFEAKNQDWKVELRFLSPHELSAQVRKSAQLDVVLLLGKDKLQELKRARVVTNPLSLFRNPVVIVAAPKIEIKEPKDLLGDEMKPVVLLKETVILGKESRRYLKQLGLVLSEKNSMTVKNQKSALEAIQKGIAKWSIVYKTETAKHQGTNIIWEPKEITAQEYFGAIVATSEKKTAAKLYLQSLLSTISRKIWENAGFVIARPARK